MIRSGLTGTARLRKGPGFFRFHPEPQQEALMADRCDDHPWGTCDCCGVDLGGVCCYLPYQYGDYDTLCYSCLLSLKRETESLIRRQS